MKIIKELKFANKGVHSIIDDLSGYREKISYLNSHLKSDDTYKIYRDSVGAKIQRRYTSRYKKLNINLPLMKNELNRRITTEAICKEIMADGFQNELIIDKKVAMKISEITGVKLQSVKDEDIEKIKMFVEVEGEIDK